MEEQFPQGKIEEIWDRLARAWQKYRNKPVQEVVEFLKDKKGKVLDLGCGTGRNFVKTQGLEWYGLDSSKKMLECAKKELEKRGINVKLFRGYAEKIPFEDKFFDAVIFISTLHCIQKEEKRREVLKEIYRVMKNGAEAIISVWNKKSIKKLQKIPAKEGFVSWKKDGKIYQRYYYFYEEDELEKLLKEAGFKIIKKDKIKKGKHSKKNIVFICKK